MTRNFAVLREKADPKPYYLAYQVTEDEEFSATATLGSLLASNERKVRRLDVTIRVGSPQLDNYHPIRGEVARFTSGVAIALEDSPDAIRRRLWLETDRVYRAATQRLIQIRTNKEVNVAADEASDDFSSEEKSSFSQLPPPIHFPASEWNERVRKLSSRFRKYPEFLSSQVSISASREVKYFVSTEGTRVEHGRPFARVMISASAKADDGMDLFTAENMSAGSPADLPKDRVIEAAIDQVAKDLSGLRKAPLVEPFVGPAVLSGKAAGVFFHEIFGHRIEGHRQKDETDGQTFTKKVGTAVLPEFLSVTFDATVKSTAGEELNGWYDFDDEGVRGRKVGIVESGILKAFLMSRTPIPGFPHSNGHGRRQPGAEVVSRQSNLLVSSARTVTEKKLREMLIVEIKRQGKPYGYYFQDITGGFTNTGRRGIQAFKVIPLVVFRVYPDGRPDELVRGADLVGTPLASFAKILAAGDRLEVFNGYCGAESGSVPVSAVSPAMLISEIEVQKKEASRERPPLLGSPALGGPQ